MGQVSFFPAAHEGITNWDVSQMRDHDIDIGGARNGKKEI
jgi:hypothetical protein